MNLNATEEQILLRESVSRFVADNFADSGAQGPDPKVWARFADLGWLALAIPESLGGLASGDGASAAVSAGIVMEGLGAGLVGEPLLTTAILASALIVKLGSPAQQQAFLPAVAAGTARFGFALEEGARYGDRPLAARAVREGAGWRLTGAKSLALDAGAERFLVVAALDAPTSAGWQAVGVFVVPAAAAGVSLRPFALPGGGAGAARLVLDGALLPAEGRLGCDAAGAVDRPDDAAGLSFALDFARSALCCEALGMMEAVLRKTVEYARTREQFGRPLSANQVVRHRLADMAIAVEEARSLSLRASMRIDAPAPERARAVSGAKARISQHLRFVCEQAVQLHGGMGVTEELDIGRYLKRSLVFDILFGDADYHLARRARDFLAA